MTQDGGHALRVSVALCTYNGADYLPAQLESLASQTRLPDELVVFDDASTDDTWRILEAFARQAPFPVRLHRNPQRVGYSRNFEQAMKACTGDVIFLCDQDDVWLPDKIAVMLRAFQAPDRPLVVVHDAYLTDAELNPSGFRGYQQIQDGRFTLDMWVTGCCTAFRAELRPLLFPIPHGAFDHDVWIHQVGRALGRRKLLPQALIYYRRHEGTASHWIQDPNTKVSFVNVLRHYVPADPRVSIRIRLDGVALIRERLLQTKEHLMGVLGGSTALQGILARLRREEEALRRRLRLLEHPFGLLRLPGAVRMLLRGDYRFFTGVWSFAKDVLTV